MIKPVCQYRNGASSQTALMTCLINPSGKARNDNIAAIAYLSGIAMCQLTGIQKAGTQLFACLYFLFDYLSGYRGYASAALCR